jgi:hypothetical protein
VLRRSTRRISGTLTVKCREGKECPNSERRFFRTHVDINFFLSSGVKKSPWNFSHTFKIHSVYRGIPSV